VFGDGEKNKLPLQAYARHLRAHGTPIAGVITEMRFDTASPTPKLIFKPVRPITEEELAVVQEMKNSKEAEEAIKLTVNVSAPKPAAALFGTPEPAKPAPKAKPSPVVEEEAAPPKKIEAKKPAASSASLESLVDGWDDE
jgi:hypothetical protein